MVSSCHMTSTLKVMLLQLPPFLEASSVEREICWRGTLKGILNENLEWEPGEKLSNSMKETGEENRGTTENILAP